MWALMLTPFSLHAKIVIQNITPAPMREIINISLPRPMAQSVRKAAKSGQYASISEFFRDLIRDYQEGKLLSELHASQKEIAEGKGKVLKSLKALR